VGGDHKTTGFVILESFEVFESFWETNQYNPLRFGWKSIHENMWPIRDQDERSRIVVFSFCI